MAEELRSSSERMHSSTYPASTCNRNQAGGTKKSHSLPDSSILPLCCINSEGSQTLEIRKQPFFSYPSSRKQKRRKESTRALLKKRLTSKSDGDSPSFHEEMYLGKNNGMHNGSETGENCCIQNAVTARMIFIVSCRARLRSLYKE